MANVDREHILQVQIKKWVRDAVDAPHVFLSFDSAKITSMFHRQKEKARGVAVGTPDCLLMVKGLPPIWCELKASGGKPSEAQEAMGARLMEIGAFWSWLSSVETYRAWLVSIGVPLRVNAEYLAMHADGQVATLIAKAEAKRGPAKSRRDAAGPRYTASAGAARRWAKAGIIAG